MFNEIYGDDEVTLQQGLNVLDGFLPGFHQQFILEFQGRPTIPVHEIVEFIEQNQNEASDISDVSSVDFPSSTTEEGDESGNDTDPDQPGAHQLDDSAIVEHGGFIGSLFNALTFVPLRKRYSNADEALLKQIQMYPIVEIKACRTPLSSFVRNAMQFISLGKWNKVEQQAHQQGIDNVVHTFLLVKVKNPSNGVTKNIVLEKNETPRIYEVQSSTITQRTEIISVVPPQFFDSTLFDALKKCQDYMKNDFWRYNAFRNNCITFCRTFLGVNGLLDAKTDEFLKQPASIALRHLPSFSQNITTQITDAARQGRTLIRA